MKRRLLLLLLAVLAALPGCSGEEQTTRRELFAMDTVMTFTIYQPEAEQIAHSIEKEILRLEQLFSVTDENSDITNINQNGGAPVTVAADTAALVQASLALAAETDGLFDISIYPLVEAWGFTKEAKAVPTEDTIQRLLPLVDYQNVTITGNQIQLKPGMALDAGGIAKGYAADRAAQLMQQAGCSGGVLSLGGNVLTVGEKPDGSLFRIALQDPQDAAKTLGTLSLPGGRAVVTSGDYQRYFEQNGKRYHHILDPRTGYPAENEFTSVTVVTASAARADAIATALFVMGLEQAKEFVNRTEDIEAVFVTKEQQIFYTKGLADSWQKEAEGYTTSVC